MSYINNIWMLHNFVFIIIAVIIICASFRKEFGMLAIFFWLYVMCSLANGFQNPWNDNNLQYRFDASCANGMVLAIIIPILAYILNNKYREFIFKLLFFVSVVDAALVWKFDYGIFNANSADCAMLAMMYPAIFWRNFKIWTIPFAAFVLITIILKGKSTGSFALAAASLAMVSSVGAWVASISCATIFGFAWLNYGNLLFNDSARFKNWIHFFEWWAININPWYGTGFGRAEWIMPYLSLEKSRLFLWMHNEYLQVLFEGGAIGLALALAVLVQFFLLSRTQDRWKLATVVSVSVVCLTQFPFRFAFSAFFICFIANIIYSESSSKVWK